MSARIIAYIKPSSVRQALSAIAAETYTVLAGGTDFFPARVGKPLNEAVLDISALNELRGICITEQGYQVGALTTWSDLLRTELPPCFDGLKQAARAIGGVQIQNCGTVGGNLCNASPAADSVPNLLALNAQVELQSVRGVRCLPIDEFILGNRRTARRPDELLTAIYIPRLDNSDRSVFLKLGARKYLVISIVMAAVLAQTDSNGRVQDIRIAVGACSEIAQRLSALEQRLLGSVYTPALLDSIEVLLLESLRPIHDVRASADYRLQAAAELVRRAIKQALEHTA